MGYVFLLTLYFIAFAGLAWKKINWAIYLIVFALPGYLIRFNLGPVPMTVLEGMILILFIIFLLRLRRDGILDFWKKIRGLKLFHCFIVSLLTFLLAATVAVLVGPDLRAALGIWKAYFVEPILFFGVFVAVIKKEELKNIFWALAGSSLTVSTVAIYQKLTGNWIANEFWAAEATRRVSGIFPYPNALALYLGPIIILLIGFLVGQEKEKSKLLNYYSVKLLGWGIVALSLLSVWWSGSKGAMIGVVAGLIFYAIFYRGYRKYFVPLVAVIFLVGIILLQSGRINLKGNYSVEGGDSLTVRQEMWMESWQMLKTKPIFGAGLAGYQEAMEPFHQKSYIEIYLYPHNIVLNFWSELGILGLLAFILVIVWFYKRVFFRLDKDLGFAIYDLRILLAATMAVIIVHGLVDVPYFKNDLSVFFWLLVGMMAVDNIRQKNKQQV
ncbi:O-antigen ligase family protein [Candidatus Kuenenbacteria bacterium]|nr:O-antigen ligase family protein [Candidatus Kuenenbacteria bacterium]